MFKDLTPGKEYKLTGVLMNKATNDKRSSMVKKYGRSYLYAKAPPEVEMTFTFDARELTAKPRS